MATRFAYANQDDAAWRRRRNKLICKRKREGDTATMLSHDYGLSESSIYRIVREGRSTSALARRRKRS